MNDKFILEGKTPVPASLEEWARWFEKSDRHVATDQVGDQFVSTVFLGLDHSFDHGPPLLFETMILGGKNDQYQERCSTWDEAEKQHATALALAQSK